MPTPPSRSPKGILVVLWLQAGYFLLTGLWPLISIRTFIQVTGEKTDHLPTGREADHWLVMTAGVLITSVGLSLVWAAWNRRASPETIVLAIAAAAGLTAIDVVYTSRGVIQPFICWMRRLKSA